jgi:hypothetical protein
MDIAGQAFEIQEIYGLESSYLGGQQKEVAACMDDQDKECIVCMSEKIDTIIMPCRHMCICVECAQEL